MFKSTFSGHNKIWGALLPNASPWLRAWHQWINMNRVIYSTTSHANIPKSRKRFMN